MSRKIVLTLLVTAVLLGSASCRKEGAPGAKKPAKAPAQGKSGTAESPPPTSVGEQPPAGGTAQQPPAGRTQPGAKAGGTDANQPAARARRRRPRQPRPAQIQASDKVGTSGSRAAGTATRFFCCRAKRRHIYPATWAARTRPVKRRTKDENRSATGPFSSALSTERGLTCICCTGRWSFWLWH